MSTFPIPPRLPKSGIVLIDPDTPAVQRIISLQHNLNLPTRALQRQVVEGWVP